MKLDKYRLQVIETLKACKDPVRAREFLAEVDLALMNGRISARAQRKFWAALNSDLDILAQGSVTLSDEQGAGFTGVVLVAQAAISLYRLSLASEEEGGVS